MKPILIVISAPSGSGKTTLINRLIRSSRRYVRSVSATTRRRRRGERDGRDYFFLSRSEFLKRMKKGGFVEWARVLGKYYGTPKEFVEKKLRAGKDVILNIDVQGAMKIKKIKGIKKVFIFVKPPSMTTLRERLKGRKTESKKEIVRRLALSKKEMSHIKEYDYVVVNRTIDGSLERIKSIIAKERKVK